MSSPKAKRQKTFTGCWTCRSRKVKCDLGRPNCDRCVKSNLECAGYDIKLRWSPCIQFDIYGQQITPSEPGNSTLTSDINEQPYFQRRNIKFVRYPDEYETYDEMDEHLSTLHSPPLVEIAENKTWIIGKFGVFRGVLAPKKKYMPRKKRKPVKFSSTETTARSASMEKEQAKLLDFDFLNFHGHEWISNELKDDAMLSAAAIQGTFSFQPPKSSAGNSSTDLPRQKNLPLETSALYNLVFHQQKQELHQSNEDIKMNAPEAKMPIDAMRVVQTTPPPFGALKISSSSVQTSGLTRFLLNYYITHVADIMTVVSAGEKNAWKNIYMPRALAAMGDLTGLGSTSHSRNSLLNAILAVTCFNLQSKFEKNSPEMTYLLNLGIEFRTQASNWLKLCMAEGLKEKYKDVVTAILSMQTIDVVWGTMADCQVHLKTCESYIRKRLIERPSVSGKAKILHQIFSSLKLISDSTSLDKVAEHEIFIDQSTTLEMLSPILQNCDDECIPADVLYGLPSSLVGLFSECVKLVRHHQFYSQRGLQPHIQFHQLCNEFEKKLLAWQAEPVSLEANGIQQCLYHHAMSFSQSLIIYYFTMVKDLNNAMLQNNVESCLNHLNEMDDIAKKKNVKIVPLIWQGFIAGCSAVDVNLQMGFKLWTSHLASSGMGSYWGARQIMYEVWRRRIKEEPDDNWYSVYTDWEMNLMLS